jgi:thiol-disulfide isomerase/thioredoxin
MNKYFKSIRLMVLLTGSMLVTSSALAKDMTGAAPDFTLKSISGENLKLSEFRGDVILINFWASWCGPCRQEMPLLDQLYQRYSPVGFTILGINVEENSDQARKLLQEVPVSFPILFDTQNSVSKLYNLVGMPSTMIVDRDGNIRYQNVAYLPGYEKKYEEQIKELIRE